MTSPAEQETINRIIRVLQEVFPRANADNVTMDADFHRDLGGDDMSQIELKIALQEEFGIEIPDDYTFAFHQLSQVVDYILDNQTQAGGGDAL